MIPAINAVFSLFCLGVGVYLLANQKKGKSWKTWGIILVIVGGLGLLLLLPYLFIVK